jgi:Tol biopolymer transport system component/imidazolonepropionase-like amidohydrolase
LAIQPTPPSAPGKLVFTSNRAELAAQEPGDIYRANSDGSGLANLTERPAMYEHPVWSPDGTQIAFVSNHEGRRQVYVMQADGSGEQVVPGTGPLDFIAGWSPDGRWLLLESARDVNSELYAVRPDGSEAVNLTRHPAGDEAPTWSPDGRSIVFVSDRGSPADSPQSQLYLLDLASGETRQLTDFRYGATFPVWSTDGSQIAFAGVRDGGYGFYDIFLMDVALATMPVSEADVRRLTQESGWTYPASWAGDGQSVLANRIWGLQGEHFEALRVATDENAAVTRFADPIAAAGSWPNSWQDNQLHTAVAFPHAGPIASPTPVPPAIALVNGVLIDGTGSAPVPDAVVVIREGHLEAAGPANQIEVPADAQVIDVQGATILPGFFNAHVHEGYDAGHLAAWAQAGVTTVRDLSPFFGSPQGLQMVYALRDAVDSHPAYARIIASSPLINPPDGYAPFMPVTSPEDARVKVNAVLDAGADLIKVAFEDSLPQGQRPVLLQLPEARAIVETAHARGVLVVAHVTLARHLELAVEAGVDEVTHMIRDALSDELIARMIEQGIYWSPTMELWQGVGIGLGTGNNLRKFVQAGGQVALGTDYAGYSMPFQLGMPMMEIELMAKAGMAPMDIIVAATRNAATVSNRGHDLGTLEPGKIADILVVNGDPLADLQALLNVQLVMRDGVVIRQEGGE